MQRIIAFLAGISGILCACNNDLSTIGQEVISNNNYIGEESYYIENIATVRADSFVTSCGLYAQSSISRMAMGKFKDEYSGETTAIPCFQIAPQTVPGIDQNAVLDSVTLVFRYADNMWGDTLYHVKPQTFYLYQLKSLPELDYDDNGYFYNNETIDTDSLISTTVFYPLVTSMAKAYFKIDQTLGDSLFDRMLYRRDKKDDIYDPTPSGIYRYYSFLQYFKGLAILPDENNDCLMTIHSIPDSLYLQFHYSVAGNNSTLRFPLSQQELQYNRITNNPVPAFASLTEQRKEVSFESTKPYFPKEVAFVQGLCGYMTKLTLPEAPQYGKYTTIIKAQLEIKPEYMFDNPIAYPDAITVYATNELNEFKGYLLNNSQAAVTGILQVNEQNSDETRYIFDMTEYYQTLSSQPPTGKGQEILLTLPSNGFSEDHLSFDQMVLREKPVLRVYYAKYK